MIESWVLWLVLAGLTIGAVATWLLLVRLPRDERDVAAAERSREAAWIAATIERGGGVAPRSLVHEVLDLHAAYLRLQPPPVETPPPPTQLAPPGRPPATPGQRPPTTR